LTHLDLLARLSKRKVLLVFVAVGKAILPEIVLSQKSATNALGVATLRRIAHQRFKLRREIAIFVSRVAILPKIAQAAGRSSGTKLDPKQDRVFIARNLGIWRRIVLLRKGKAVSNVGEKDTSPEIAQKLVSWQLTIENVIFARRMVTSQKIALPKLLKKREHAFFAKLLGILPKIAHLSKEMGVSGVVRKDTRHGLVLQRHLLQMRIAISVNSMAM